MCVILDASIAGVLMSNSDFRPLLGWIDSTPGMIVYGGRQGEELAKVTDLAKRLRSWSASGHARQIDAERLKSEEAIVREIGLCKSNDVHVIALARVTGARILAADDHNLETDFKNQGLVPSPGGHVYKNQQHSHLLRRGHTKACAAR